MLYRVDGCHGRARTTKLTDKLILNIFLVSVNYTHTVNRSWTDDIAASISTVPMRKGERLIICHAGKTKWFDKISNDDAWLDYHCCWKAMQAFDGWVSDLKKKCSLHLPQNVNRTSFTWIGLPQTKLVVNQPMHFCVANEHFLVYYPRRVIKKMNR